MVFLSVLYSGRSPKAPGTAGSALSVLLGLPILLYSAQTLFLLACLLGIIAVREIDKWEAYSGKHDEKWIVIDELVGVWLAMSILCYGNPSLWLTIDKSADIWLIISTLWHEGHFVHIMLAFVLFRVFDIWKPSIIGRIDRKLKGGLGVVLDDVAAGIVAGIAGILVLFAYDVAVGIISARAY
ncbi:phosphatidylglycerophosphatase A [Helicobacter canis]|uniref:phosphatidylglycerophosphatase A family protein n=1 Tax=Helicobacter canis TaxID=29419 RepID=UPI0029439630|nr:phosphatidylglycerophosphatase A [Helicobacter canis]